MSELISLQQVYLMAIAAACKSLKLDCILQDMGNDTGRLWLAPFGSTVPVAQLGFRFSQDSGGLAIVGRDERRLERVSKFAEGSASFLAACTRFFQAARIAAPKAAARKRPRRSTF